MVAKIEDHPARTWSIADSIELYRIESWGDPYFFVNGLGHMAVRSLDDKDTELDIAAIVAEIRRRGVQLPALIRFQDILSAQVRRLSEAFSAAIAECGYGNVYRGVYPIKVNQLHEDLSDDSSCEPMR